MKALLSILFLLSSSQYSLQQSQAIVESLRLEDPLLVSTLASADTPFATLDPNDVGEVCIITTDDNGQTISLTPSSALFKRMGDEVQKAGSSTGNVTAVDEILYEGYSKAVTKRLVTAGAIASFFSIVRKVIATAAVYFSAKALYDNPLHLPQPPALKIEFTHKNLEEIEDLNPQVSDTPGNKELILLVSTVGGNGYETVTIPDDVVSMPNTLTPSATITVSTSTATKPRNCPTGSGIATCDDATCLGIKNPIAKGKICSKDGPLKGCDCDYCIKDIDKQFVCSDQSKCKGAVSGSNSTAAQCTTGDQQDCDCKCGLADLDLPMCDADKATCDPNAADTCQKQTEDAIGCECLALGVAVVDTVDAQFVSFVSAVNSKLAKSDTTGYLALTSLLPDLSAIEVGSMSGRAVATAMPNATMTNATIKTTDPVVTCGDIRARDLRAAGLNAEHCQTSIGRGDTTFVKAVATSTSAANKPTDPVVVCDAIKDPTAANWTARYWDANGNWKPDAVAADVGKKYNELTGNNLWRYNNAQFLNDPIGQFCKQAVADMPQGGFAAGAVYNANKTPYNKYTLEEVQFRIELPADGGATIIKEADCVTNLKMVSPKCQIFKNTNYAVWGGSVDVGNIKWYILPQYIRQPAVERPTAYAQQKYAPGRTTWEVHGAGWLTDDFGQGLYSDGGFAQSGSGNSGGHLYFTPSGFADPFGMEWWANGQFILKIESLRRSFVEEGVSSHGGPLHSISWWNDAKVSWPENWNGLFARNLCEGSAPGCAARSLVPKPLGPLPPKKRLR